jgi:hypothetical protein
MRITLALTLLLAAACSAPTTAQTTPAGDPVGLRGDFSGAWYNPEQSGHGLMIEVLDRGKAAIAWYTFDPSGDPVWLQGLVDIVDDGLSGNLSTVSGGHFPPQFNADSVVRHAWGAVKLTVTGCDSAEFSWNPVDPAYSAGSLALTRLTALQGQRCNAEQAFGEQRIYSFEHGALGFVPLFVDLPTTGHGIYELDFRHEQLPAPLSGRRGLRLTGHNRSDDLAMFVVAPVGGLRADTLYRVELELELASNVPTGCFGIGGSPGDSVYIKLGASTEQPQAVEVDEGVDHWFRANVDIGNQSQAGEQTRVVGTLANTQPCDDLAAARWELKTLSTQGQPLSVRTDDAGRFWLLAGSDSAFEGLTRFYLTALRVRLLADDAAQ